MTISLRLIVRKDFPVGREWKQGVRSHCEGASTQSERTFPLEGNGNACRDEGDSIQGFNCPKGLSRWKGMETQLTGNVRNVILCVRKDFPGRREWKHYSKCYYIRVGGSERTFPLEGNGNDSPNRISRYGSNTTVRKDFPVGREWKQISSSNPVRV